MSVERGLMVFLISIAVTFLTAKNVVWHAALFLGLTVFCIWSAVDSMNNICDLDLDMLPDPVRAEYTKRFGKTVLLVAYSFTGFSLGLGAATLPPLVFLFVVLALFFVFLFCASFSAQEN